jgi:hypothetical protein
MAKKTDQILSDDMERAADIEKAADHLLLVELNQGRDGLASENFKAALAPHLPEGSTIEAFLYNGKPRLVWRAKPSDKPQEKPPEKAKFPF